MLSVHSWSLFFSCLLFLSLSCDADPEGTASSENEATEIGEVPFQVVGGRFEKRERLYEDRNLTTLVQDSNLEQFEYGVVSIHRARRHMIPDRDHRQFAMYRDESLILDLGYLMTGRSETKFQLRLLANGRLVDFELLEAPEGNFATGEELEDLSSTGSMVKHVALQEGEATFFTLVARSDAFQTTGVFDLRLLATPDVSPDPERAQFRMIPLSESFTLYREGTEFPPLPRPKSPAGISKDFQTVVQWFRLSNSVLLPSSVPLDSFETKLGGEFSGSNSDAIAFFLGPIGGEGANDEVKVLTNFLVNGELAREWELNEIPRVPNGPGTLPDVPFQRLSVDEEAEIVFIQLYRPLRDNSEVAGLTELTDVSNVLFFGE